MAIKEVCRLCLTADELIWVFDKRFESSNNMKDVIFITTGVEISAKDIISQKICKKCCQVTVKMFEFRRTSLKNDQHLREQCKIFLKDKEIKIPNTQVIIRGEAENKSANDENKTDTKAEVQNKQESKPFYKIHPTVRDLFKIHPQIKLPTVCLKYNISPCVAMKMNQVEQYFESRNIDFHEHTKLALKAGKVATKRTSSVISKTKNKASKSEDVNPFKVKWNFPPPCGRNSPKPTPETSNVSIHRKSFEDDNVKTKEEKKTNFIESLGLTPKMQEPLEGQLSYVANRSLPLHICEICNSVQYSAKDLRKHQNRHLRCQFCKVKLRSLENKQAHLDSECPIKNMMNNLPSVVIEKVEFNMWARRTYPEAFQDFPLPEGLTLDNLVPKDESANEISAEPAESKDISDSVASDEVEVVVPQSCEVIEILSDDEEPSLSLSSAVKRPLDDSAAEPPPTKIPKIPQPLPDNIVYSTVSIVRPDIKIKGNNILDMIDARLSDIKVLKELLVLYRPVSLFVEQSAQTERPHNKSISVHQADTSGELRMLKPQLHVYKVPIEFKNGPFDVHYDYSAGPKPPKKLCLWNDLTVLDVKPSNSKPSHNVSNENLNPHNNTVLSSTSTRPSPGTTKFIRVNANSLSPIASSNVISPTVNLVSRNPMLNHILQNAQTESTEASMDVKANTQVANTEAAQQFGVIRVKNVWELT